MPRICFLALLACAGLPSPRAQRAPPPPPQFDAVSVRELSPAAVSNTTISPVMVGLLDPSEWQAHYQPLLYTVMAAYDIGPEGQFRVVGLPKWAHRVLFDIKARVPPHAHAAQIPAMLRAMLADKFALKAHWETRLMPAVVMSVAPGGPKLHRDPACESPDRPLAYAYPFTRRATGAPLESSPGCGTWQRSVAKNGDFVSIFHGVTMQQFARLSTRRNLPVLDQTHLPGAYDFTITVLPANLRGLTPEQERERREEMNRESERTLIKQLGLDVDYSQPRKLPVPVLVVDHITRPASH